MYLTEQGLGRAVTLPIALAQTEIRRGGELRLATVVVEPGQILILRSLTLHLVQVLTPESNPDLNSTSLGLVSVGLYFGPMRCSGLAVVKANQVGVFSLNPFSLKRVTSPGTYEVIVGNNASNIDISVAVTGALRLWLP